MNEIDKNLIQAIFEKDIATITKLLQKGANIHYVDNENESTPLLIAIKNNYLSIAKILLDNGADPNNQQAYTLPLIEAIDTAAQRPLYNFEIEEYSLDMINLLLE